MMARIVMPVMILLLGGCVSLLPKPGADPDIFRLSAAPQSTTSAQSPLVVLPVVFAPKALRNNRVAISDGGNGIAYAAGARWAAPMPELFHTLQSDMLNAHGLRSAAVPGGVRGDYTLVLEVRRFEAVYDNGPGRAPLALVRIKARLVDRISHSLLQTTTIEASVRASEDRLSPIILAIDAAAQKATADVAQWTADAVSR